MNTFRTRKCFLVTLLVIRMAVFMPDLILSKRVGYSSGCLSVAIKNRQAIGFLYSCGVLVGLASLEADLAINFILNRYNVKAAWLLG